MLSANQNTDLKSERRMYKYFRPKKKSLGILMDDVGTESLGKFEPLIEDLDKMRLFEELMQARSRFDSYCNIMSWHENELWRILTKKLFSDHPNPPSIAKLNELVGIYYYAYVNDNHLVSFPMDWRFRMAMVFCSRDKFMDDIVNIFPVNNDLGPLEYFCKDNALVLDSSNNIQLCNNRGGSSSAVSFHTDSSLQGQVPDTSEFEIIESSIYRLFGSNSENAEMILVYVMLR
ncbi:uncharacterized protein [Euphorbia lathyris]|uniref:uncharacterized protein n=1 Tax=Euphorbia lathyris TaxID=212925 RepID=UPI003313E4FB